MLIGAGTVLDAETVTSVINAGALFIISPNLDIAVTDFESIKQACIEKKIDLVLVG